MSTTNDNTKATIEQIEPTTLVEWRIPGAYRDVEDMAIRVQRLANGGARVVVDGGNLWSDERAELTATKLREMADALDPTPAVGERAS